MTSLSFPVSCPETPCSVDPCVGKDPVIGNTGIRVDFIFGIIPISVVRLAVKGVGRVPSFSADRNTMVHGGHELRALSANRLGKLPDHAALQPHGRTSVRVDAAVPYLEALVLLVDRTGKACAGCLEQHRSFLGIKALCREHRDEILGSQFRRIAEVQTMIEILQGTVTAYVISIPGCIRAAGGD